MKKRIEKILTSIPVWTVAINLCIIAIAIVVQKGQIGEVLEVKSYVSLVLAIATNTIIMGIVNSIKMKFEDSDKLSDDYDALSKKYSLAKGGFHYINSGFADYRTGRKRTHCQRKNETGQTDEYIFPVADVMDLQGKKLCILDKKTPYQLPAEAQENFNRLKEIHNATKMYNTTVFRLDGVETAGEQVDFIIGRSQYFYSMATNRSIDYPINGLSLRDVLECGPTLSELSDSKLSNHIGYNGILETADGKVIFVVRNKRVSVGKNMLQVSVGASLKYHRAIDKNGDLTLPGIVNAMKEEIVDELSLKYLPQFTLRRDAIFADFGPDNICYYYRDIVEGGKPQFLFVGKIGLTAEEISAAVRAENQSKCTNLLEKYTKRDGENVLFVPKEDLEKIYIAPDILVLPTKKGKSRAFRIMPSHAFSLALIIQKNRELDIVEYACKSKLDPQVDTDAQEKCEDGIYVGKQLAAVIDGVTAKGKSKGKKSPGVLALNALWQVLRDCDTNGITDNREILSRMDNALKKINRGNRKTAQASVIFYNRHTKSLVSYGDCQYLTNLGPSLSFRKDLDARLEQMRAEKILSCIAAENADAVERRFLHKEKDQGRNSIVPILLQAERLANQDAAQGGYPVINGKGINPTLITEIPLAGCEELVLASDGYPKLFPTLGESEAHLSALLKKDPLCYRENPSTKGVYIGQISYDDRAYVRLRLKK